MSEVFGYPDGRRLPGPSPDEVVFTLRVLRRASDELVRTLHEHIDEVPEDALERRDAGVWVDTRDGAEYQLRVEFVDPVAPAEQGVTAFAVRDEHVLYLRPFGAADEGTSTSLGEIGGRRASGKERVA